MKVCEVLLKVVLVVVFVEAVLGGGDPGSKTVEGGASSGTAERVCPPEAGDHMMTSLADKVVRLCAPCFEELQVTRLNKHENTTTEELRTFFDGVCQKKPIFKQCLSEKASNLEVCSDPKILKLFNIMREFLERKFESGCAQNAERFVRFYSGRAPDRKQGENCMSRFSTIKKDLEKNNVDISSEVFILYKQIIAFKECFRTIELDPPLREEFDYFIDETITTMQCINPEDDNLVTCASLDPSLVNFTNICDVKTQHNTLNLYDVLEDDAFLWLSQDYHSAIPDEGDFTTDNEKAREHFKQFCDLMPVLTNHLSEVKVLSQLCSSETEKNEFNLLGDTLISGYELACTGDGRRISDIMFEVYRLHRTSPPDEDDAVWKCIDAAKATRNQVDEHKSSSKNMRFYHELETLKECLVNKLQGDQTIVEAATSLINGLLEIVKCVNPEDGSTVSCASLMHSQSHAHAH